MQLESLAVGFAASAERQQPQRDLTLRNRLAEINLNSSQVHAGKITPGMNALPIGGKDTRV